MTKTAMFARVTLAATLAAGPAMTAQAMMTTPDSPEPTSTSSASDEQMAEARAAIEAGNYQAALGPLQGIVAAEPQNADAFNLLGYALRSLNQYNEAMDAYGRALAIDPEHLGANEYLGELLLMIGNLAGAQERLAVLDEVCYLGCDEYDALETAIDDYMSAE
jgi:Flp pilus assembly protein TadD